MASNWQSFSEEGSNNGNIMQSKLGHLIFQTSRLQFKLFMINSLGCIAITLMFLLYIHWALGIPLKLGLLAYTQVNGSLCHKTRPLFLLCLLLHALHVVDLNIPFNPCSLS